MFHWMAQMEALVVAQLVDGNDVSSSLGFEVNAKKKEAVKNFLITDKVPDNLEPIATVAGRCNVANYLICLERVRVQEMYLLSLLQ